MLWFGKVGSICRITTPILSTKCKHEPAFWIVQRCFQSFARMQCLLSACDVSRRLWNAALARTHSKHTIGPIIVLMAHLEDCLVPKLRAKVGLGDMSSFSIEASAWYSGYPQTDAFMAVLRPGGLFTNRVKSKFVEGHTDKCILCGQKDWVIHRLYKCHQVHQARQVASWDL